MRQAQSERRGPGRPVNGDTAICPRCVSGTMEFNERTRDAASSVTAPAWTCDSCGTVKAVRGRKPSADAVPSEVTRLRTKSTRVGARPVMQKRPTRKKPKAN